MEHATSAMRKATSQESVQMLKEPHREVHVTSVEKKGTLPVNVQLNLDLLAMEIVENVNNLVILHVNALKTNLENQTLAAALVAVSVMLTKEGLELPAAEVSVSQQVVVFGTPTEGGGFGEPSEGDGESGGFGAPMEGGFGAPSSGGFGNRDGESRGGRSGYRGGRGGGGGRGRGGRGGGRGREFDRRSGNDKSSSVKGSEKRDGSGSYNWGTPGDENATSEETGGFGTPGSDGETQEQGLESSEDKENHTPEMSYEDYMKQQDEVRSKTTFNLRKANEGVKVKGKELKKLTEEENEKDGDIFFPKTYYEERNKSSGRVKEHVVFDLKYGHGENRHMEERGGRRGRGGSRGGRGGDRGGDRRGGDRDIRLAEGASSGGGFGTSKADIQLASNDEFPCL